MATSGSNIRIQTPVGIRPVPKHGAEVTVTIDGIEFTVHYGFIRANRPTIVFTSRKSGDEVSQLFISYKSLSEGFWRLAMGAGSYYKGQIDYITQTFIHMALQKFFNDTYGSLPAPSADNVDLYFQVRGPQLIKELNAANNTNSIHTNRKTVEPVFKTIKSASSEYLFTPPYIPGGPPPRQRGTKMFFERNDPLENFYKSKTYVSPSFLQPTVATNSGNSSPVLSTPNEDDFMAKFKKRANENAAIPRKNNNLISLIRQKYNAGQTINATSAMRMFGDLAEANFEIVGDQTFTLSTNLLFPRASNATKTDGFTMDIFSIPVRSKDTGQTYIFYIGYYTYQGQNYKHLVNIIPADSKILPNGLYSKYVSAGNFIFKPFDYSTQCYAVGGQVVCDSTDYEFIGHVFQDMWPLKVLEKPGGAGSSKNNGANKGGRRSRKTTRRSKKRRGTRKRSA